MENPRDRKAALNGFIYAMVRVKYFDVEHDSNEEFRQNQKIDCRDSSWSGG